MPNYLSAKLLCFYARTHVDERRGHFENDLWIRKHIYLYIYSVYILCFYIYIRINEHIDE